MATQRGGASSKGKAGVPNSDFPIPPVYVVAPRPLKQDWELVVGWIAALVLVVLMLPLLGMLYMDVLQTKKEAQAQIEKMEKLRREFEKEKRDDSNSSVPPR
jgi:cbb3-type cytochrome oxidase subunit 3